MFFSLLLSLNCSSDCENLLIYDVLEYNQMFYSIGSELKIWFDQIGSEKYKLLKCWTKQKKKQKEKRLNKTKKYKRELNR